MKKIVFICQHNTCRSQIAECLAKRMLDETEYEIVSCGIHGADKINERALSVLRRMYGVESVKDLYVKKANEEILFGADRIIALGTDVETGILLGKDYEVWDVTDPSGGEYSDYIDTMGVLKNKILSIEK